MMAHIAQFFALVLAIQPTPAPPEGELAFTIHVRNHSQSGVWVATSESPRGAVVQPGETGRVRVQSARDEVNGRVRIVLAARDEQGYTLSTLAVTGFDADSTVFWGEPASVLGAPDVATRVPVESGFERLLAARIDAPAIPTLDLIDVLLGPDARNGLNAFAPDGGAALKLRPCAMVGWCGVQYVSCIGARFSWVPPGNAKLGRPNGAPFEQPVSFDLRHGFWIAQTEFTDLEWSLTDLIAGKVDIVEMRAKRSEMKASGDIPRGCSWRSARAVMARASSADSLSWVLPTEAQWEYACRLRSEGRYAQAGDGRMLTDKEFWHSGAARGEIKPVAVLVPSTIGLYDLHGNVMEWCRDRFRKRIDVTGEKLEEDGAKPVGEHVVRGGWSGWPAEACECGARDGSNDEPVGQDVTGVRPIIETGLDSPEP
jgi:formylglycine-generating enzyme required for sulfatase activity